MRWPLTRLIGRSRVTPSRDPSAGGLEGESATVAVDGPANGSAGSPFDRPSHDWAGLPPIHRTLSPMPTAASPVFVEGIAGRRAPDPILKPLDHLAGGDGPIGLVGTALVPDAARQPGASRGSSVAVTPGAARHPLAGARDPASTGARAARRPSSDAFPGAGPDEHGREPVVTDWGAASPARHVHAVEQDRVEQARVLTEITAGPEFMGGRPGSPGGDVPAAPRLESPTMRVAPEMARDVAPPATPGGAIEPGSRAGQVPRLTLAQTRRLGLGAPLPAVPASSVPAETASETASSAHGPVPARPSPAAAVPAVAPAPPPAAPPPAMPPESSTSAAPPPLRPAPAHPASAASVTGGAVRPLPVLRLPAHGAHVIAPGMTDRPGGSPEGTGSAVSNSAAAIPARPGVAQRPAPGPATDTADAPSPPSASRSHAALPALAPAAPAPSRPAPRPLLGVRPDVRVSGQATAPVPDRAGTWSGGPGGAARPGSPANRLPSLPTISVPSTAEQVTAGAPAHPAPAPLGRTGAVAPHAPAATHARAAAHVPLPVARAAQRLAWPNGAAPSSEITPSTPPADLSMGASGAVASAAPIGAMAGPPPAGATSGADRPAVPRSAAPTVQRAVSVDEVTATAEPAHDAQQDEQLARRIYDRIRNRLEVELLLDRERAGLLADLRS